MNDHVSSTCAFLIFTLSIHWSSSQRTERQHAPTNVFFDHDCASVSTHALGMQAIGLKSGCRWTTFLAFIGTHGEAKQFHVYALRTSGGAGAYSINLGEITLWKVGSSEVLFSNLLAFTALGARTRRKTKVKASSCLNLLLLTLR